MVEAKEEDSVKSISAQSGRKWVALLRAREEEEEVDRVAPEEDRDTERRLFGM